MNRLFVLKVGSQEIRGLISPGELPDVVITFYHESERYGAKADFLVSGELVATKGDVEVRLRIESVSESMPSRQLKDVLEEVMEKAFSERFF